jgi:hypothetical protein
MTGGAFGDPARVFLLPRDIRRHARNGVVGPVRLRVVAM